LRPCREKRRTDHRLQTQKKKGRRGKGGHIANFRISRDSAPPKPKKKEKRLIRFVHLSFRSRLSRRRKGGEKEKKGGGRPEKEKQIILPTPDLTQTRGEKEEGAGLIFCALTYASVESGWEEEREKKRRKGSAIVRRILLKLLLRPNRRNVKEATCLFVSNPRLIQKF